MRAFGTYTEGTTRNYSCLTWYWNITYKHIINEKAFGTYTEGPILAIAASTIPLIAVITGVLHERTTATTTTTTTLLY